MWTTAGRSRDQFKLNWIYGVTGRADLCLERDRIHSGLNSGHQAMALAYFFGVKKIILLGYDMGRHHGQVHWHGNHPRGMGNGGRFHQWIADMNSIAKDFTAQSIEVINCSRHTNLKCFPQSTIQEALP